MYMHFSSFIFLFLSCFYFSLSPLETAPLMWSLPVKWPSGSRGCIQGSVKDGYLRILSDQDNHKSENRASIRIEMSPWTLRPHRVHPHILGAIVSERMNLYVYVHGMESKAAKPNKVDVSISSVRFVPCAKMNVSEFDKQLHHDLTLGLNVAVLLGEGETLRCRVL